MNIWLIVFIIFILLFVMYLYNGLIHKKSKAAYAYSGMDVILKKRSDLVPGLVNVVKAYAKHEQEILSRTTEIRNRVVEPIEDTAEKLKLEGALTGLLNNINAVAENYPDLKADEHFLQLQRAVNEVEEQLSAARRAYNAAVYDFNTGLETFPSGIIAKLMRYKRKPFFKIAEKETL